MHDDFFQKVKDSYEDLKRKVKGAQPRLAIVLTGGMDAFIDQMTEVQKLPFTDVQGFSKSLAQGHVGRLVFGKIQGDEVVVIQGRNHYYEGLSAQQVVFPTFVLHEMGVQALVNINAVGGISYRLQAGDLFLIRDHINYMGDDPLRGISVQKENNQFTDLSHPYDLQFMEFAKEEAKKNRLDLKEGTYLATKGPCYETNAEIKMFRSWGADTVGMSSVFEIMACNYLNVRVLALSIVANVSTDRLHEGHDHEKVLEAVKKAARDLSKMVFACCQRILKRLSVSS